MTVLNLLHAAWLIATVAAALAAGAGLVHDALAANPPTPPTQ